jgi:hypothetical protein
VLDSDIYQAFIDDLMHLPGISDILSKKDLQQPVAGLLGNLALLKNNPNNDNSLDFEQMAREWFEEIIAVVERRDCYVPVIGLTVERPLKLGNVVFWPANEARDQLQQGMKQLPKSFSLGLFDNLSPDKDCIATCKVEAGPVKTGELLAEDVERAVNLPRYISTFIWDDEEDIPHVYVAGRDITRISYILALGKTKAFELGYSAYPTAFGIDDSILQSAHAKGLEYLQALLTKRHPSELEEILLLAISWFGDATQDIFPGIAFVKYYTSIECITKRDEENRTSEVLPKRIAAILGSDPKERAKIEAKMGEIIYERNNLLHGGKTQERSLEYLRDECRRIARDTLNEIRIVASHGLFSEKDALIAWADAGKRI